MKTLKVRLSVLYISENMPRSVHSCLRDRVVSYNRSSGAGPPGNREGRQEAGKKAEINFTTSLSPITSMSQKLRRPALLGGVTGSPGPGLGGKVLARLAELLVSIDPLLRLPVGTRHYRLLSLTINPHVRQPSQPQDW